MIYKRLGRAVSRCQRDFLSTRLSNLGDVGAVEVGLWRNVDSDAIGGAIGHWLDTPHRLLLSAVGLQVVVFVAVLVAVLVAAASFGAPSFRLNAFAFGVVK